MTPLITGVKIAEGASKVLSEILVSSGNSSCLVTSVERTTKDQARVMYANCEQFGGDHQLRLYKKPGQAVVSVFMAMHGSGATKADILAAMEAEITHQGPERVSAHCRGPESPIWVIDIAPSSFKDSAKFIEEAEKHKRVTKVLKPPQDPAVHLEVLKDG